MYTDGLSYNHYNFLFENKSLTTNKLLAYINFGGGRAFGVDLLAMALILKTYTIQQRDSPGFVILKHNISMRYIVVNHN